MEQNKSKSSRVPSKSLEAYRPLIQRLYTEEELRLVDIMEIMQKNWGLDASENMYKKKFRQWKLYKNRRTDSTSQMEAHSTYRFFMVEGNPAAQVGKRAYRLHNDPKSISLPITLKIEQEMLHAGYSFTAQRLSIRLQPPGSSQSLPWKRVPFEKRQRLSGSQEVNAFVANIQYGVELFNQSNLPSAMAALEKGLRHVEGMINEDHFSLTQAIIRLLVFVWRANMLECIPIIMKQIYSMASICHGHNHPLRTWSKNFLDLWMAVDVDLLFIPMLKVFADACEEMLGPEDSYTKMAMAQYIGTSGTIYAKKNDLQPLGSLTRKIDAIMDQYATVEELLPLDYSIINLYAENMVDLEQFDRAERYYKSTSLRSLDINDITTEFKLRQLRKCSMWSAVVDLINLANVFSLQGDFASSRILLLQVIPVAEQWFGADSPDTLRAIQIYAETLQGQHLDDDANALYNDINGRLLPYRLIKA